MRILHTSDWHIGRSFHGLNTVGAFLEYADFLLQTVRSADIDAVLVSGDVFDRAIPPLDALDAYEDTIARLLEAGVRVIVTSGNHDSHQRLGVGRRLMEASGLFIRTSLSDIERPAVLGDGGDRVAVYGIPYLEPALVSGEFNTKRTHSAVLGEAISRIRTHRDAELPDATTVVMAHAFASGGTPSDSERSIEIGGVGKADVELFTWADYTALGHLHRPQEPAPNVRYSGSPLPYSFSEHGVQKLMWLYDSQTGRVERIDIPEILRIAALSGTVDELVQKAPDYQEHAVQVHVADPAVPRGALRTLRSAFPGLLSVQWTNLHEPRVSRRRQTDTPDDGQLFADFCEATAGRQPTEAERALFDDALQWAQEQTR